MSNYEIITRGSGQFELDNNTIRVCVLKTEGGCMSHLSPTAGTDRQTDRQSWDASTTENGFTPITSVYKSWESCMSFNRSKL